MQTFKYNCLGGLKKSWGKFLTIHRDKNRVDKWFNLLGQGYKIWCLGDKMQVVILHKYRHIGVSCQGFTISNDYMQVVIFTNFRKVNFRQIVMLGLQGLDLVIPKQVQSFQTHFSDIFLKKAIFLGLAIGLFR